MDTVCELNAGKYAPRPAEGWQAGACQNASPSPQTSWPRQP
jgi:hypothetical protein